MIIKLLWLACSLIVFKHVFKSFIKDELDTWDELDTITFMMLGLVSFIISLLGPIVIIAYIVYNVLEGVVQAINEAHKKPKDDKWRYYSDPR
jgi:type III secretory pathway component EscU